MSYQLISIILPVYNQGDHIQAVVESYENALSHLSCPHENLLIVNNCRDNSLEVCQSLAERLTNTRLLHSQQGGWGLAVKLGLKKSRGDLLCYTNSARTVAPDLQLALLYAIANPNTVIKANRKIRENYVRLFGSLLYNLECRLLFDLPYWDINGTPKVFPRAYEKLLGLTRDDDLIDVEFNVICRRNNYPVLEVPILSTQRRSGKSTTGMQSAMRMYLGVLKMWRTVRKKANEQTTAR
ncbi:MAG: glycosyltransferase [Chloroflexota bacterium]